MRQSKLNLKARQSGHLPKFAAVAILLLAGIPAISRAQRPGQKTFASAEEASSALAAAAQANDETAMLAIFGPDGKQVVYSGDDVQDREMHANFAKKYVQMHRLVNEPDGTTTLYIGAENWPTPIPLVQKDGAWYFDTDAARREILFRRIGQNELSAIRVTQELAAAQKEYSAANGGAYAMKFVSDEGQHNGLYWLGANDQYASPIGPLIADAGSAGGVSKNLQAGPVPFR